MSFIQSHTFKSYTGTTQGVGNGAFFLAGFYEAPATDANLTQASATQVYGSANNAYAAHAFVVAGGAGTVDTGVVGLRVTGTRIQDDGTRTASYQDVLSTDITTLSANDYLEGVKFNGQVTFELYVVSGTPTTYSLDFNYGTAKYEDFGNHNFQITDIDAVGLAGATDAGFDIELIHHKATGWIYSAAAFVPGPPALVKMSTDHGTERSAVNGVSFAYKRAALITEVTGSDSEGLLIRFTTTVNNAIEYMDAHIGVVLRHTH